MPTGGASTLDTPPVGTPASGTPASGAPVIGVIARQDVSATWQGYATYGQGQSYVHSVALAGGAPALIPLELSETARYFDVVVSMEDTQRGKPDPQVFQVAAERLGAAPHRCVVFEDAVAGVQAAKAGGMKCIAVTFVGHHPEEALRRAGADCVVRTLESVDLHMVRELIGEE